MKTNTDEPGCADLIEPAPSSKSIKFDWFMAALGGWFVVGIFLIGRAYNQFPAPDTLFSPWHLMLYSGSFVNGLIAIYILAGGRLSLRRLRWALLPGYELHPMGVAIILISGMAGLVWLWFFGISGNIRSLPNPIYLGVALGSVLMVMGPLRSAWRRSNSGLSRRDGVSLLPGVLSLTYVLSIITFFTQFAHPFVEPLAATDVSSLQVFDEIKVMDADGRNQTRLTTNPDSADWDPAWSPDGSRFTFVSKRNGVSEIYAMNADGSDPTRLTFNEARDWDPTWSPDGERIVYASDQDGEFEIYVMNADGTEQIRLTFNQSLDRNAAWSPDGGKIAFASDRDGDSEIYVMNADGSEQDRLTLSKGEDIRPSWSPDGEKIAFVSYRDNDFEIYAMNSDGSGQVNLTDNEGTDWLPAWSPGGGKVAFVSERDGNFEVYVMNADGTGQMNLSRSPGTEEGQPSWSPDADRIAFSARGRPRLSPEELGIASMVLQTGLMMGFVLLALRRWTPPLGSISIIFSLNAALMTTQEDTYWLIPAAVAAGVTADALIWLSGPFTGRVLTLRALSFAVPVIFYVYYFLTLVFTEGVGWPPEIWSGATLLAGFVGLLLSYLVVPPAGSDRQR